MNLLRHRRVSRDVRLELPNGDTRLVKVVTEDHRHVQHVHDWTGAIHGTGCPQPLTVRVESPRVARGRIRLPRAGMPKGRQVFARQSDDGPWVPVPGTLEALLTLPNGEKVRV